MQFSPKILGLNARIFGTFSDSPGLNFRDCFWTVRNWVFGIVSGSRELNFWDCFGQSYD